MSKIERFEDLEVWKMARSFSKNIYLTLEKKPFLKDYRLRDQMRGSVGSIMDNIAEGFERNGNNKMQQNRKSDYSFISFKRVSPSSIYMEAISLILSCPKLKRS